MVFASMRGRLSKIVAGSAAESCESNSSSRRLNTTCDGKRMAAQKPKRTRKARKARKSHTLNSFWRRTRIWRVKVKDGQTWSNDKTWAILLRFSHLCLCNFEVSSSHLAFILWHNSDITMYIRMWMLQNCCFDLKLKNDTFLRCKKSQHLPDWHWEAPASPLPVAASHNLQPKPRSVPEQNVSRLCIQIQRCLSWFTT